MITYAINAREIYTVKALQAVGVPLPFLSLPDTTPTGFRGWLQKVGVPFGRHSFYAYSAHTIQSQAMTKFLIEKGVGVNSSVILDRYWTPLGIGNVNATPLMVALAVGRVEAARLLIAHGANVHARDSIGRSALTVAITYCPAAIELLLAHGADVKAKDKSGLTALDLAKQSDNQEIIRSFMGAKDLELSVKSKTVK